MPELAKGGSSDKLKVSIPKLIKNDMWTYPIMAIFLIVVGLYLVLEYSGYGFVRRNGAYIGNESAWLYGAAIPVMLPVLLIVIYWRFARIRAILSKGVLAKGRITDISRLDHGSVVVLVRYVYGERRYRHRKIVAFPNKAVFQKGNDVEMVVNPEKPRQALINDLFLKKEKQ